MSMKAKPNTAAFRPPRDPSAFLDGAEAERTDKAPAAAPALPANAAAAALLAAESAPRRGRGRVQKIFNFPEELADRLHEQARVRSQLKGSRVTEKDLVVEALEAYLPKP